MTTTCIICDTFTYKQIRKIDSVLRRGADPIKLAKKVKVSEEDMLWHADNCLIDSSDGYAILDRSVQHLSYIARMLVRDIEEGKHLEVNEDDGIDGRSLLSNFITTQRELRESVITLGKLKSSKALLDSLREVVIDPLVKQVTIMAIEEASRMRDDLFTITSGDEVLQRRIKTAIDNMLSRFAERLKDESYEGITEKVEQVITSSN